MRAPQSYNSVAKSFHWLIVLMVAIQFTVGWIMPEIRGNTTPEGLVSFHFSFGILILVVMLLRLVWRLTHKVPPPIAGTSQSQEFAAQSVHYLLYATLIILPITGWGLASARGWTTSMFGIVTLPPLVAASNSARRLFDTLHVGTATIVAFLIAGHIVAALYHHFVLKDGLLNRMLPKSMVR